MRIAIIGGGPSGILSAIMLKKKNPKYEVILIEKEERLGKKIYVSGNGRCNLANNSVGEKLYHSYRHPVFTREIFENLEILKTLQELGIDLRLEDNLWYPYTEHAKTVMDVFNYHLKKENIIVKNKTAMVDYCYKDNHIEVTLDKETLFVDKLVVACGGKSSSVHGSDGTIFDILKNHGYIVTPLYPGLVPVKIKEDVSTLKGIKIKCLVTLTQGEEIIYQENGEVLFKEDGLSGIAIMNCSSLIARNIENQNFDIHLDLFPHLSKDELLNMWIDKEQNGYPYLDGSLIGPLARYVENLTHTKGRKSKEELKAVVNIVKNLSFTFDSLYSFKTSQVTVGGICIDEIKENFESRKENNVYILGETLDNDGLCGGYNLMWCWACALQFVNKLDK